MRGVFILFVNYSEGGVIVNKVKNVLKLEVSEVRGGILLTSYF